MIITDENDREMTEVLGDPAVWEILKIFDRICAVPHGSGNEAALAEMLKQDAVSKNHRAEIDDAGNLLITIPAVPGYEHAPVLMFQGHLDMVCAAADGTDYDAAADPVISVSARDEVTEKLIIRSDRRSSLGADCGMGNAAVLWLFEGMHEEIKHGPVKILFTTDEEEGLMGAKQLDPAVLDGVRYLVNVDGFTAGKFVAGCAGGRREIFRRECGTVKTRDIVGYNIGNTYAFELCLKNFSGGHSGFDIDKGRINPVVLMCSILSSFREAGVDYALSSLRGGIAHNVIPSSAEAVITIKKRDLMTCQQCIQTALDGILADESAHDDGILTYYEVRVPETSFDRESRDALTGFAGAVHEGVIKFMEEFPEIVDTSCNLGRISACAGSGETPFILLFERSMDPECHDDVVAEHLDAAGKYGFEPEVEAEYDAWHFDSDNPLLAMAEDAWHDAAGSTAEAGAVHIGVEPAVFCGYRPDLIMISCGTSLHDPHTIYERCETESIRPFAYTLKGIAERVAEEKQQ